MILDDYNATCGIASDINEHSPTLKKYADEVDHVTEFGVRWCHQQKHS